MVQLRLQSHARPPPPPPEPDRAQTLRKSLPLIGSHTFPAAARTALPHCITLRHLNDAFSSRFNTELSDMFDSDDHPSSYSEDTVLCFDNKEEHDLWQCAPPPTRPFLTIARARVCVCVRTNTVQIRLERQRGALLPAHVPALHPAQLRLLTHAYAIGCLHVTRFAAVSLVLVRLRLLSVAQPPVFHSQTASL